MVNLTVTLQIPHSQLLLFINEKKLTSLRTEQLIASHRKKDGPRKSLSEIPTAGKRVGFGLWCSLAKHSFKVYVYLLSAADTQFHWLRVRNH